MDSQQLQGLLAKDKLYDAMALLGHAFLSSRRLLQEEESKYRADPSAHAAEYQAALGLLLDEPPLVFSNRLPLDKPLVLLQSLDEALTQRYGATRSPPPQVEVEGRQYLIVHRPLPRTQHAAYAGKAGSLQAWLRHHWLIPAQPTIDQNLAVRISSAADALRRTAADLLQRGEVRLFVAQLADGVTPRWNTDGDWLAQGLSDTERRWQTVLQVLKEASRTPSPADVLVFPELALCPVLSGRLQTWLDDNPGHPFMLVLAGSFHQNIDGKIYNQAELLDASGHVILRHRKFTAYGDKQRAENVQLGDTIPVLATPLGLLATPICLDFCDERLGTLWQSLGIEWLLTPSFGGKATINAHKRRAQELQRAHASVTALANQHPDGLAQDAGFVCHDDNLKIFAGVPVVVALRGLGD